MWNIRELTLRRATNLVARKMRVAADAPAPCDEMRSAICARSLFPSGCEANLRLEMRALPLAEWAGIDAPVACIDRRAEAEPIRVCRLYEPLFPGGAPGRGLATGGAGGAGYAVRVATGFVTEPGA